jgi:hypothetical protein
MTMPPAPDTTTPPSPAQRAANDNAAAARALVTASATATTAVLPRVRQLLPAGWHATSYQAIRGATHTVAVDPPTSLVDATAYLLPRTDQAGRVAGWWVRVHNRAQRVDFPLYTRGGADAAVFEGVDAAVDAAITALRVEAAPARTGRPR